MAAENGGVVAKPTWEEVLGSKNWEGLLDPLDLSLRRFILRAGDFCQCSSDAFNNDENSDYYGNSRYGKKSFFNKVKFQFAEFYQVYSLLYTTASLSFIVTVHKSTSFQGFIAVSTDAIAQLLGRREIFIVWRGTVTLDEWAEDAKFLPTSAAPILRPGTTDPPNVMQGFLEVYTDSNPDSDFTKLSARDQLHAKMKELMEVYKGETLSIVVAGHSLGGALAVLSAFDLVENGAVGDVPVTAVTFGGPRVGDAKFKERLENYGNLHVLRVVNQLDMVPHMPLEFMGYKHVGVELKINGVISPYLNTSEKKWHDLEGMLHVVAGWNGKNAAFELKVKRSLALVNKTSNFLKAEYKIPETWWVVENKGMIIDENGEWVLAPALYDDLPQPEF